MSDFVLNLNIFKKEFAKLCECARKTSFGENLNPKKDLKV